MDITTVIINFQTPDLLRTAVTSFKKVYPEVDLLILDNGSKDNSIEEINELKCRFDNISVIELKENIYHGPAMDLVCKKYISSDYTFFLDSDTETKQGGFLEQMYSQFDAKKVYGVGEFNIVNNRGFKSDTGLRILQTPYMLLDTEIYNRLPPFIHHGQPTLFNFKKAQEDGYELEEFNVSDYIDHRWRGTADKFGYGLGWRGKLDYVLNKLGI